MNSNGFIDLHIHSNVSDGKLSVPDIIQIAKENNTKVLSFTEHYNMGSYHLAKKLAADTIEIIPGAEIGASLSEFGLSKNHVCHILAYYPSYKICHILDTYEESRDKCVKKTLRKLQNQLKITYSDVVKHARDKKRC